MSELDQHLFVCNPVAAEAREIESWRKAIRSVANIILDDEHSPWQMTEMLAGIAAGGRLESDGFGHRAASVIARAGPETWGPGNGLIGAVCALCAGIHVLRNRRLTANAERRDLMAVSLWSALSFQRPLGVQMLERLRAEVLNSARDAGMAMARKVRGRSLVLERESGTNLREQNRALRNNAQQDREEIGLLRWMLADESTLLGRPYKEVDPPTEALAKGLELGLMLSRFPSFEHYQLASRSVRRGKALSLAVLVEKLGEDRERLAGPFGNDAAIGACPAGFPLLTALGGGSTGGLAGEVDRSRADWCGRALLESAMVELARRMRGART